MDLELRLDTVAPLLPTRAPDAHKGAFGHVLVMAGSLGMLGAAKLACGAAARSGAGLVTLALPERLADAAGAALTETMLLPLACGPEGAFAEEALAEALEAAAARDAAVLGPGLSQRGGAAAFARGFALDCAAPLVIDADGLNALAGMAERLRERRAATVITPHPGEMARLMPDSGGMSRAGAAGSAAAAWNCVVVLKGRGTVVAAPDGRVALNTTGGHGLAKGGTGDVLAGLVGGLLAQGVEAFDAACVGVFAHGLAGDRAEAAVGARGMVASDVVAALPEAWQLIERAQ